MLATRGLPIGRMICILVAVGLLAFPAQAKYSGGGGTAKDPWRIATKKDLLALAADTKDYASHFILTADIDLSKQPFTLAVIAPCPKVGHQGEFVGTPFTGTFNGNGHKITSLKIEGYHQSYLGLFGCIARGALVKDLYMERATLLGGSTVGMVVGLNDGGAITDCSAAGDITDSTWVGALAGVNGAGGTITRCQTITGTMTGHAPVGGLVGRNAPNARITDCRADGNVIGDWVGTGGLAGLNEGVIARCKATGGVTGTGECCPGGLVGDNQGMLIHCQSVGSVAGGGIVAAFGGLVASNAGTIIDCRATGDVTSQNGKNLGGLVGLNGGFITHCSATGSVTNTGEWDSVTTGGLAAYNGGIIACSYAAGNVASRDGLFMGAGLAGWNQGTIINCYATGSVSGICVTGGLAAAHDGTITNCYAVGKVTGNSKRTSHVGGLIASVNVPGEVVSSYWDTQTSGQSTSAGGMGKTTAEMKTAKTFLDGGWDFNCIWDIVEHQSYPFLRFNPPADLTCDGKVDLKDFARFAANWSKRCGVSTNPKKPLPTCPLAGDLNYDKSVDAKDLSLLAVQWLDSREQAVVQ